MSALTVPTTHPSAGSSTARSATVTGTPTLRLVPAPTVERLAPSGPLQAWRRRLGALVVLAALVVVVVGTLFGAPGADAPTMSPVSAVTVVVQPGQTLWDVAEVHTPAGVAPRTYVRQLAELNGVVNGSLDAWQVLRLPAA